MLVKKGEVSESVVGEGPSKRAVRFFLAARGGLLWVVEGRFVFSLEVAGAVVVGGEAGPLGALELEAVRVCGVFGAARPAPGPESGGGGGVDSAMSSDSGTRRSSIGCELGTTPVPVTGGPPGAPVRLSSCLGRPRAAAAQERRVVRDARRAASLSAW